MQNTLQLCTDKNCHGETTGCEHSRDLSPVNRLYRSLSSDVRLLSTYLGIGNLQAGNSVGQVVFIRKNWKVDFAIRHQALLCAIGKI